MFGPPLPMETLVSAPIYLLSHKRRICNSCVVYINIVCTKGQCVIHVRKYTHINMAFLLKQANLLTTKASDDLEPILPFVAFFSFQVTTLGREALLSLSLSSFWSFVVDSFSFDYFRGGGPQLSIAQLTTDGNGSEKCPCQVSSDRFSLFFLDPFFHQVIQSVVLSDQHCFEACKL